MNRKYKVATIQFSPQLGRKADNTRQLVEMCKKAASNGAKLIVLPEMATTGYCFYHRDELRDLVESVPGPTTSAFQEVAQQYSCYIVLGLPEVDPETGTFYNTCVLVGPDSIVGKYRKTHLYVADTKWAASGDLGLPVFDTDIGKIGCLICMDYCFFEPARIMALQGAEVLCNLSNWNIETCPAPSWISRAWENNVYVIAANRSDRERGVQFSGGSTIIEPDGTIQQYMDSGEGIVYGEVDLDRVASRSGLLENRRPQHYKLLNINLYLYNPFLVHRFYEHEQFPEGKESMISVFQFDPIPLNVDENLNKIGEAAAAAADQQAELLVLPELALSGPVITRSEADRMAVSLPDHQIIDRLVTIAQKYGLYLLLGIIEKERNQLFNTVVFIDETGVSEKYRKVHLNVMDQLWATPGEKGFAYIDKPLGRIGLLSGDDCKFGESTMSLAVQGVDVIGVPSAVTDPAPVHLNATEVPLSPEFTNVEDDPTHWHLWRTRAVETNTYIAFANQTGKGGMGKSGIFGPLDWPRQESVLDREERVIVYKMDTGSANDAFPDKYVRVKENVRMRLPHLYGRLVRE